MEEELQNVSEKKLYPTYQISSLLNMHRSTVSNKLRGAVEAGWLEEDDYTFRDGYRKKTLDEQGYERFKAFLEDEQSFCVICEELIEDKQESYQYNRRKYCSIEREREGHRDRLAQRYGEQIITAIDEAENDRWKSRKACYQDLDLPFCQDLYQKTMRSMEKQGYMFPIKRKTCRYCDSEIDPSLTRQENISIVRHAREIHVAISMYSTITGENHFCPSMIMSVLFAAMTKSWTYIILMKITTKGALKVIRETLLVTTSDSSSCVRTVTDCTMPAN